MAACNPSDLLAQARCFECLSKHQLQAIIAQLLCDINASGGGGGGSGTVYLTGNGSPVGAETPTFIGEIYTRNDVAEVWKSTGLTNVDWIQIV